MFRAEKSRSALAIPVENILFNEVQSRLELMPSHYDLSLMNLRDSSVTLKHL